MSAILDKFEAGPVRILCKEVGFQFCADMETPELLIAFVRVLVDHVAGDRETKVQISAIIGLDATGKPMNAPSEASADVLRRVRQMLVSRSDEIVAEAAKCHDLIHEVHLEDDYPTDHCIDQLNSCVSAIRFGLEKPCNSRHAADAANHIWKLRYGIHLFDNCTGDWSKDWTRQQLQRAIVDLAVKRERERCLRIFRMYDDRSERWNGLPIDRSIALERIDELIAGEPDFSIFTPATRGA